MKKNSSAEITAKKCANSKKDAEDILKLAEQLRQHSLYGYVPNYLRKNTFK